MVQLANQPANGGIDWAAIGQMIVVLAALDVVIWYTLETRRYRQVSERTLEQLQAQYEKSYKWYLINNWWVKLGP